MKWKGAANTNSWSNAIMMNNGWGTEGLGSGQKAKTIWEGEGSDLGGHFGRVGGSGSVAVSRSLSVSATD
jgi:hypothetical protein